MYLRYNKKVEIVGIEPTKSSISLRTIKPEIPIYFTNNNFKSLLHVLNGSERLFYCYVIKVTLFLDKPKES